MDDLVAAFGIAPPELIALTGGGGKTSLMFALARAIPGRIVATTTTRIFAAQLRQAPVSGSWPDAADWLGAALQANKFALVVGEVQGEKALGVAADVPGRLLALPDVQAVIVEADGSRMRPVKAPAAHEPVIPPDATLVIPVVGIDALEGPLERVAHRPELVSRLAGVALDERLTPAALAALLVHVEGGMKGVPAGARVVPCINKVETEEQLAAAREVAGRVLEGSGVERVVLTSLRGERPVREVFGS